MTKKPIILTEGAYNLGELQAMLNRHADIRVIDLLDEQLQELYEINHPGQPTLSKQEALGHYLKAHGVTERQLLGDWVYFPWNGNLIHMVAQTELSQLRANRNQLLISPSEQQQLAESCIAFAGLSIGSHFVSSLIYSGIAKMIKLADPDTLSTTNLNRIHATLAEIGQPKIDIATRHGYEINPYQQFEEYPEGLKQLNIDQFLHGEQKPDLIFEAVDDFKLKIQLRIAAREQGIPVVMLTNLGDTVLIDIERFDLEPQLPLFNGLIGDTPETILGAPISGKDKVQYAVDIITLENTPTRALQTLLEIGETLVGRPQLYSTVVISGGIASYLARRLILKKSLPSGRIRISLKEIAGFIDDTDSGDRNAVIHQLNKKLGRD